jgi:stage V sporulation protein SpoVS
MAITINAKTSGAGGLETTADNTGNINIQSGGSTVMSVTSSGVAITGALSQNGGAYSTQPTFRNRIINGDMRIDQRNAGASVTPVTLELIH